MTSARAGQPAAPGDLVDVAKLVTAYFAVHPDPGEPAQRVSFGTSGHRGSAFTATFNEDHIAATTQAICEYRAGQGIRGPLYLGADTHALSEPAQVTALEVLAANGVHVLCDARGGYTPTPAVSRAILAHNAPGSAHRADGIVVTPSHNPPTDGGFKYNPPDGGPAGTDITRWIQDRANELLASGLAGVRRIPYARAAAAATTGRFDFLDAYVSALGRAVDLAAVKAAGIRIGADPLGGASVAYWGAIGERYGLDLTVVNPNVDATFRVHDPGLGRQDPDGLLVTVGHGRADRPPARLHDRDRQRHRRRPARHRHPGRRAAEPQPLPRRRHRLPVPAPGRLAGHGGGRQDAGQLVDDRPGGRWPGPAAARGAGRVQVVRAWPARRFRRVRRRGKRRCLVPAARRVGVDDRQGRDPARPAGLGDHRRDREDAVRALPRPDRARYGEPAYARIDSPATREQKAALAKLSPDQITADRLAGEKITAVLTTAPGNGEPIGGLKVVTESGWFAARPSGTEDVYKLYAESFRGPGQLAAIQEEARAVVAAALG